MIFYFTGTGNSYAAAKALLGKDEKLISMGEAIRSRSYVYRIEEDEKIGFVFPVYFAGLPTAVEWFVKKLRLTGGRAGFTYAVITCGSSPGAADTALEKILAEKEISLDQCYRLVMPENYFILFPIPSEEEQEEILGNAAKALQMIRIDIGAGPAQPDAGDCCCVSHEHSENDPAESCCVSHEHSENDSAESCCADHDHPENDPAENCCADHVHPEDPQPDAEELLAGIASCTYHSNAAVRAASKPLHAIYTSGLARKTGSFWVDDQCVSCHACEKRCPCGAISLIDGVPTWIKETCVMCLGCARCGAIHYGRTDEKNGRYKHPVFRKKSYHH